MELSTHYTRTGRDKPDIGQELGISPILGQLLVQQGNYKGSRCQEVFPPAIARPA